MIYSFRLFLTAVCFLLGSMTFAQNSSSAKIYDEVPAPRDMGRWTVEGQMQAHSVAGQGSPWLGIAGAYRVIEWVNVGLRGFVPLSHTVDQSTYAIEGFARLRIIRASGTDFFFEPSYSENFYDFNPRSSLGLSFGAMTRVTSGLSVGIVGGLEFAKYVIDSVGLEDRNDWITYPKIALAADFNF